MLISISLIEDIKDFVQIANNYSCGIIAKSGPYCVDAKSILGLLSLNLSKPIEIIIHGDKIAENDFIEAIAKYIITDDHDNSLMC